MLSKSALQHFSKKTSFHRDLQFSSVENILQKHKLKVTNSLCGQIHYADITWTSLNESETSEIKNTQWLGIIGHAVYLKILSIYRAGPGRHLCVTVKVDNQVNVHNH